MRHHKLKISFLNMKSISIIKLIMLFLIVLVCSLTTHSLLLAFQALLDIFLILALIQLFPNRFRTLKYLIQSLLLAFSLINLVIVTFSGQYLNYLMVSNILSLTDLSSNFWKYFLVLFFVLLAAFLPIKFKVSLSTRKRRITTLVIFFAWGLGNYYKIVETPIFAYDVLASSIQEMKSTDTSIVNVPQKEKTAIYNEFRRSNIPSGSNTGLSQPNVIVIFTEGMSQEEMTYDAGKLTPNLNNFKNQTISFNNYFNQTAATYRGVRGQLFSSQQLDNGYENGVDQINQNFSTNLVSVQSILASQGYQTEFLNAEPNNAPWTSYTKNLGFQKDITGNASQFITLANTTFMGDQQNYQLLFQQASQMNASGKPFMLATYTFQTHLSLNASLTFGNGQNSDLNKFYNMDNAFGKFWKEFEQSPLYKNTIVVFTADHAAYPDQLYQSTFDTRRNYFLSPVPLMIYYPGVKPQQMNAGGKNSLTLAPTVLDLMGDTNVSNYFLGDSLFSGQTTPYEYLSAIPPQYFDTQGATEADTKENKNLSTVNPQTLASLKQFFKISLNEKKPDSLANEGND